MEKEILINEKQIKLLDNYDSLINAVLEKIGLKNVHVPVSYNEVSKRNRIYRDLLNDEMLREKFKEFNPQETIPQEGNAFLAFYYSPIKGNSLQYFKQTSEILAYIQEKCNSEFLKELARNYSKKLEEIKEKEVSAAETIRKEVEKSAYIQGRVSLTFRDNVNHSNGNSGRASEWRRTEAINGPVYGYRKNFYGLFKKIQLEIPKWTQKKIWKIMGISRFYLRRMSREINKENQINFYKDYILKETPPQVIEDISLFLKENILDNEEFDSMAPNGNIKFDIFYSYKDEELTISILDIGAKIEIESHVKKIQFNHKTIVGEMEGIENKNEEFIQQTFLEKAKNTFIRSIQNITKVSALIQKENFRIPSPKTNEDFQFSDVNHLYKKDEVRADFENSNVFRREIRSTFHELKYMVSNIEVLLKKSEKWGIPLTIPEVIDGKNIVSFNELVPIHLIGREDQNGNEMSIKDIKSIKGLPPLNGKLIGITGENAGGKTVCHETIMYNLYLAQAGLPIFGIDFMFNPKEVLGILSLERGQGSTMELQIRKTKKIFEALENTNSTSSFVFLDEIGTGTSPEAGIEYGKSVLKGMQKMGCSCIFTTQLSAIAEFAEMELNALNYHLDKNHEIKPGFKRPSLENLIEKEGLDKYL